MELPPLDVTDQDEQTALAIGYRGPELTVLRILVCRERQLAAALEGNLRLRSQLARDDEEMATLAKSAESSTPPESSEPA